MLTRFQLIGVGLAVAFVWAVIGAVKSPETVHAQGQTDSAPKHRFSSAEIAAQEAAHDRETQIRIAGLMKLETARVRREKAATKTTETRKFIQLTHGPRWASVLASNWPTYLELRAQAARSPTMDTLCTICMGRQNLDFCIVCPDHKGECITCRGSGHVAGDEVCPNCLGNGKCYLCFGLGQMPCPFCNDGMVEARRPVPSSYLPIYAR